MGIFSPEELELFKRECHRFATETYTGERRNQLLDAGQFGAAEWRAFADLGWLSIAIPPSIGGMGGGLSDQLTLFRTAGRGLFLEPLVSTLVIGLGLIEQLGSDEQKTELLRRIGSGKLTLGFAHTPTAVGDGPVGVASRWNSESCRFVLSGTKRSVLHGKAVDLLLLTATGGRDHELQCFFVDPHTHGLTWRPYSTIDGRMAADVDFHDVSIRKDARLGSTGVDIALQRILAAAAIAAAAESVGAMGALNELTLDYVKVREQFGRTLGSFQVLQHRIVDMLIATRKTDALTKAAARAYDEGSNDYRRLASACKVVAGRAGRFVAEQAIQVHGAIGMTSEYPAGHYLKRLLLLGACFGDADFHLQAISEMNHPME